MKMPICEVRLMFFPILHKINQGKVEFYVLLNPGGNDSLLCTLVKQAKTHVIIGLFRFFLDLLLGSSRGCSRVCSCCRSSSSKCRWISKVGLDL